MNAQPPDDNLLNFIVTSVESLRDQMASMRDQMVTKDDLAGLARKSDLEHLEAKMDVGMAAIRGDIEQVQLRLDSIERTLSARMGQIEAELSRVRSVVYLLAKGQPELLRLLGQS